jgi:hypothetical protein
MKGDKRYGWFIMGNRGRTCRTLVAWICCTACIKLLHSLATSAGLDRIVVQPVRGYARSYIKAAKI